jgi:hypothetical protein
VSLLEAFSSPLLLNSISDIIRDALRLRPTRFVVCRVFRSFVPSRQTSETHNRLDPKATTRLEDCFADLEIAKDQKDDE